MNRLMQEKWPWIEGAHGMRSQLRDILNDDDLAFSPGGQNITLGDLFCWIDEIDHLSQGDEQAVAQAGSGVDWVR